jgi:hypothetical protein
MEESLASGAETLPCEACPAEKLEELIQGPYGQGIPAVLDLDFALQSGISITLEQLNYREFRLLRHLTDERNQYETEQIEKKRRG